MYKEIDTYGIVGDLCTVALVGHDGSIDFMCWPDFDSPTLFAALLDDQKGGSFKISPVWEQGITITKQMYLPDTNILFTRLLSDDGIAEICDYMPVGVPKLKGRLVRRLKTIRGEIKYRLFCGPSFNYGLSEHKIFLKKEGIVFESREDKLAIFLRTDMPLKIEKGAACAEFTLKAGQTINFILENYDPAIAPISAESYIEGALEATINFWRQWIKHSTYQGRWREIVNRSALTLKLLTSEKYGSMVASPTFGLPELIGGPRNWDYRYTWIRDTSFTLNVLMRLGYREECGAFMRWIEARCAQLKADDSLQIMYGIDGRQDLTEKTLPHLEGYKKSHPVHIGNAASGQIQLDIYGELMESVYLYNKCGHPISYHFWDDLLRLMEWLCKNWQKPDKGIWEIRGPEQSFLYSKVMCWVALDRAIKLAIERSFPAPLGKWLQLRDAINVEIRRDYWDPRIQAFTQFKGSKAMDASSLILPIVGFISADDPLWLSTLKAIEEELVDDSHVFRYRVDKAADDGVPGQEGTFCMCTYWYVECLARCGRVNQARFYFEKMLGYSNHLGLFAEELGPKGEGLGNFPQAFTHLSLINAAYELDHRLNLLGKD